MARAHEAVRFFIEPEGQNNRPGWVEAILGKQVLERSEHLYERILAIIGAAAPDVGAVVVAGERGVSPVGRVGDGDGVLVGEEEEGFEGGIGAGEGVEEGEMVDVV